MPAAVLLLCLLATSTESPLEVVRRGNEEVQRLLAEPSPTAEALAQKIDAFVDFGELAKRALGKEWERLDAAQRRDFSATLEQLLRASYAKKAAGQGQAQTRYEKQTLLQDEAEVHTRLTVGKQTYPVVYRLHQAEPGAPWQVFDVVTDEVSLLETYREQFQKLIAQKGFDGLLATLKKKRDQLERRLAP